ncbi:MAG: efflux RND transporter periplasmic adaptor subunit [Pseudomonadota bacterium]
MKSKTVHLSLASSLALLVQLSGGGAGAQGAQTFDCVIEPAVIVDLASPVGGLIDDIAVVRGDIVSKGQVVAKLESGVEITTVELMALRAGSAAEVDAFRARLALAQSREERLSTLIERGIGTKEELEDAQAAVRVAESEIRMAEMRLRAAQVEMKRAEAVLEQRTIVSPIDGLVLDRMLDTGEYADRDTAVIRIAQLDPLHVEAFLPIDMFARLKPGDSAQVRPAPPISGDYTGELIVVDRVFDAASSTFGVRIEVSNAELNIPAGHRCVVEFSEAE